MSSDAVTTVGSMSTAAVTSSHSDQLWFDVYLRVLEYAVCNRRFSSPEFLDVLRTEDRLRREDRVGSHIAHRGDTRPRGRQDDVSRLRVEANIKVRLGRGAEKRP